MIIQFLNKKKILIDPEVSNTRAIHVYQKVGFKITGEFIASWHPELHYQMELREPCPEGRGIDLEGASPLPNSELNNPAVKDGVFFRLDKNAKQFLTA